MLEPGRRGISRRVGAASGVTVVVLGRSPDPGVRLSAHERARNVRSIYRFANDPNAVELSTIGLYLLISAAYAVAYSVFALSVGMWLFQTRELGGAEG